MPDEPQAPGEGDEQPGAHEQDGPELQSSVMDELQQEFAQEAEKPRLFKRLPARSGRLVAEYRPVKKKQAVKAVEKDSDTMLLNLALVDLHVEAPDDERADERGLVKLTVLSGQPELGTLGFDHRLCEILGLKKGSVHDIVMQLFEGNDLALAVQVGEIGEWTADTKKKAYQDFLSE